MTTPGTDPLTMPAPAGPIRALYFIAVPFSPFHDRRRALRAAAGPGGDEACALDLVPEEIGPVESVTAARASVRRGGGRAGGHGDVL